MNVKIGKIVCSTIVCLLLSSASLAGALKPDLISDIRTVEYSVNYMQSMMIDVWTMIDSFLREKAIPASDCRGNYNLNFFIISPDEMLKEERFSSFFRANNLRPSLLYAFYDTTPNVYADSAIILSNFGRAQNNRSVSHELSHYWWDRLCVANHYDSSGEAFAVEFEAYYQRNR